MVSWFLVVSLCLLVVIRPCLGGFLVVSWWFLGGFLDGFLVVSWLFPNSKRFGLLTLKAVRRHRVSWPLSWAGRFPVSRWGLCSVSVVSWWCLGGVSVVSWWCLGSVSVVSRW